MKTGAGFLVLLVAVSVGACGKKGPPLPPLIRLPVPPVEFSASRRAADVTLQFVVPGVNTDGSKPADLSRVDVYAFDGPRTAVADEVIRRGVKVGSVVVNTPKDPDDPDADLSKKKGARLTGLDQNQPGKVTETLPAGGTVEGPDVRAYVAVGFNERGRRGAVARAFVPLVAPPPAPSTPAITYDEKAIAVTWTAPPAETGKTFAFELYAADKEEVRLTDRPLDAPHFEDSRIEWDAERCYVVRTYEPIGDLHIESAASPRVCVTLKDTFAPAAPVGLRGVPSEGAVDLIWDASAEGDLAGYRVLRAIAPEQNLAVVTLALLTETTFRDTVPRGATVTYAIQAVDKAGNASALSPRETVTAR